MAFRKGVYSRTRKIIVRTVFSQGFSFYLSRPRFRITAALFETKFFKYLKGEEALGSASVTVRSEAGNTDEPPLPSEVL